MSTVSKKNIPNISVKSCVRNILTKNYQNLLTGFQVTVKMLGMFFFRHSVLLLQFTVDDDVCGGRVFSEVVLCYARVTSGVHLPDGV